jgi:hypothetical protein
MYKMLGLYITMNLIVALYCALIFFVLTPGVLLRIPSNGSKLVVAGVHALVFAAVLYLTQKFVWKLSLGLEGMDNYAVQGQASCKSGQYLNNGVCVDR